MNEQDLRIAQERSSGRTVVSATFLCPEKKDDFKICSSIEMRKDLPSTLNRTYQLEPVCCKKRPKIVPDQLLQYYTGLENKGPLKILNGTKLILDDHGNNYSFRISLESFRGAPTAQISNWSGTILCRFLQQSGSKMWIL